MCRDQPRIYTVVFSFSVLRASRTFSMRDKGTVYCEGRGWNETKMLMDRQKKNKSGFFFVALFPSCWLNVGKSSTCLKCRNRCTCVFCSPPSSRYYYSVSILAALLGQTHWVKMQEIRRSLGGEEKLQRINKKKSSLFFKKFHSKLRRRKMSVKLKQTACFNSEVLDWQNIQWWI